MSKKKQKGTPTRVVTITQSGNTVWAHVSDAYGREITGTAGAARCHPGDTFDFYEGARIALARAFRQNPFPRVPEKTDSEKPDFTSGRWVKPVDGRKGEVGDWIRIDKPWASCGLYERGDLYQIRRVDANPTKGIYVRTKRELDAYIAQHEYSVWVPESEKVTAEALPTKPDPLVPQFKVGDIVKTGDDPFAASCRDCVAKITSVQTEQNFVRYGLDVRPKDGGIRQQCCSQFRDESAPLTLIWREEK